MEMPDAYLKNRDVIWNSQSNLFWQSHTFADLNPKVPGLILYFLCFCHSKSFLVSWFLQFPVIQEPADSPHVCFRTFDFPAFSLMSLFSVCSLQIAKSLLAEQILATLCHNLKNRTEIPWGVMLSHCIFQSSTCYSFTISVSIADISIQTQIKRIRDMRAL